MHWREYLALICRLTPPPVPRITEMAPGAPCSAPKSNEHVSSDPSKRGYRQHVLPPLSRLAHTYPRPPTITTRSVIL